MKPNITRSAQIISILVVILIITIAVPEYTQPQTVYAHLGPIQSVGHWDINRQCVISIKGTDAVENITKDTLAGEWSPSWNIQSLKAGAALIRTDAIYFDSHPDIGPCNQSGSTYKWRDSRMNYIPNNTNKTTNTNSAVDTTHPYGLKSSGNLIYYEFNLCYQQKTRDRANAGYLYDTILQNFYYPDSTACGLPGHTGNLISVIN